MSNSLSVLYKGIWRATKWCFVPFYLLWNQAVGGRVGKAFRSPVVVRNGTLLRIPVIVIGFSTLGPLLCFPSGVSRNPAILEQLPGSFAGQGVVE